MDATGAGAEVVRGDSMRKSGRVRLSDVRRAYRLVHDCRDVGHDPAAWPVVLADGLIRLVDAAVIVAGEMRLHPTGLAHSTTLLVDRGWASPACRAFWEETYMGAGAYTRAETYRRYTAIEGDLVTRTREQLVDDGEWDASEERCEYHRMMEVDDLMSSNARSGSPPVLQGFQILRGLGRPRFGPAERRLVRIFHREFIRHVGRSIATGPGEPIASLPPRLRQTFDLLMGGDSEKQVASRLGLSRHTIHDYVTKLYRRLGVESRGELMALGLRHRTGPATAPTGSEAPAPTGPR